jgi:hypothetical protein
VSVIASSDEENGSPFIVPRQKDGLGTVSEKNGTRYHVVVPGLEPEKSVVGKRYARWKARYELGHQISVRDGALLLSTQKKPSSTFNTRAGAYPNTSLERFSCVTVAEPQLAVAQTISGLILQPHRKRPAFGN